MYDLVTFSERVNATERYGRFKQVLDTVVTPNWQHGPWVAGGSIRRLVTGEDPLGSDVDVFFADEQQYLAWFASIEKDKNISISNNRQNQYNMSFDVAIQDSDDAPGNPQDPIRAKIQAIFINYYNDPQAVIDSFDYTICQFVTDGWHLLVGPYTLWDTARKRLVINNVTYGVSTLRRMFKYTKQGFYACSGMMVEFLKAIAEDPTIINEEFVSID
jgi:hypothetical protein